MAKILGIDGLTLEAVATDVKRGGRFVYYPYVVSVVFLSFRRASDMYYVPAGQDAAQPGLPYALTSLLLGWWGFPWGLLWTPAALAVTLSGGKDVTQGVLAALTGVPRTTRATPTGSTAGGGQRPKLRCDTCWQHVRAVLQGAQYRCPYCGQPVPSSSVAAAAGIGAG